MKNFLRNGYKLGKGAIRGILDEYNIPEKDHNDFLIKLDNEINTDIDISNKQSQTQAIIMGVPFDDYKFERNKKDLCEKELLVLFKKKDILHISKEEEEFLTRMKSNSFFVSDKHRNGNNPFPEDQKIIFSLLSKDILVKEKVEFGRSIYIQNIFTYEVKK